MSARGTMTDKIAERLALYGAEALTEVELLSGLLGCSEDTAQAVLGATLGQGLPGLRGVLPGVPAAQARKLRCAVELATRLTHKPLNQKTPISQAAHVVELFARLRTETREYFYALALDAKHRPLAEILVSVGGVASCAVSPADVFRQVLTRTPTATSVIFVHNHPSGDPGPSDSDNAVTQLLCKGGKLLGLSVLDHVIVAQSGHYSYLDSGLLGGW